MNQENKQTAMQLNQKKRNKRRASKNLRKIYPQLGQRKFVEQNQIEIDQNKSQKSPPKLVVTYVGPNSKTIEEDNDYNFDQKNELNFEQQSRTDHRFPRRSSLTLSQNTDLYQRKKNQKSEQIRGHLHAQQQKAKLDLSKQSEENIKQSQSKQIQKKSIVEYLKERKKIIGIVAIVFIMVLVLSILLGTLLQPPLSPPSPPPVDSDLILVRNYNMYEIYVLQYQNMLTTTQYSLQTVYNVVYFVSSYNILKNNNIQIGFGATVEIQSESLIKQNGEVERTKSFNTTNGIGSILRDHNESLTEQQIKQFKSNSNCQQRQIQNKAIQCVNPVLKSFNFILYKNGKIKQIAFSKEISKQQIALYKNFIKMFSPDLQISLYSHLPQKLRTNSNQSSINHYYKNFLPQKQTLLIKQSQIASKNNIESSIEQFTQQSYFDQITNQLKNTTITSTYKASSNKYSPAPSLRIEIEQKSQLSVLEKFIAKTNSIEKYGDFMNEYNRDRQILTMSDQEFEYYIQNSSQSGTARRQLQNKDEKTQIKYISSLIFTTNLVGFQVQVYDYSRINLSWQEYPKNPDSHQILLQFDTGYLFVFGSQKFQHPVSKSTSTVEPLPSKYTLQLIQNLTKTLQIDLLPTITSLSQTLSPPDPYQNSTYPLIQQILNQLSNINNHLTQQYIDSSPKQQFQQLQDQITNLHVLYNRTYLQPLQIDNSSINIIAQQLYSYINATFQQILYGFSDNRDSLESIRTKTLSYLTTMEVYFISRNITQISNSIQQLINPQLQLQYNKQMTIATPISNLQQYILSTSQQYFQTITEYSNKIHLNFLQIIDKQLTSYYTHQNQRLYPIQQHILSQQQDFQIQHQEIFNKTQQLAALYNTSNNYLMQIVLDGEIDQSVLEEFQQIVYNVTVGAQGASSQRFVGCCSNVNPCDRYNAGEGQQLQPSIWAQTKQYIYNTFTLLANNALQFIHNSTQILNRHQPIQQKLQTIQELYKQTLTTQLPTTNNTLLLTLQEHLSNSTLYYNEIACGPKQNFEQLLQDLQKLEQFVSNFTVSYNQLQLRYVDIVGKFDVGVYRFVAGSSGWTGETVRFQGEVAEMFGNLRGSFQRLAEAHWQFNYSNVGLVFVNNQTLTAPQIQSIYTDIQSILENRCTFRAQYESQINQIRSQYASKLQQALNYQSQPLQNQLQALVDFLNASSLHIFSSYLQVPFCSLQTTFLTHKKFLETELHNFTGIYTTWNQFSSITTTIHNYLQQMNTKLYSLQSTYEQQFTKEQHQEHILTMYKLVQLIPDFIHQVSIKFSYFKENSKQLLVYTFVDKAQLIALQEQIVGCPFQLLSYQTFGQLQVRKKQALEVVQKISYDAIVAFVLNKNVQHYYQQSIDQFRQGLAIIRNQFLDIIQAFIYIGRIDSQNQLNQITQKLTKFLPTLNSTVFPNITGGIRTIKDKFVQYQFHDSKMKSMFQNGVAVMDEFGSKMGSAQSNIYRDMHAIVKQVISLTAELQIQSMDLMNQLVVTLRQQIDALMATYFQQTHKLSTYQASCQQNITNLLQTNFTSLQQSIPPALKTKLQQTDSTLKSQTKSTLASLQKHYDKQLYQQFLSTNIYKSLVTLQNGGLSTKSNVFSINGDMSACVMKIQGIVGDIEKEQSVVEYLGRCLQAEERISRVSGRIGQLVEVIADEDSFPRRKLFLLSNMYYTNLTQDLQLMSHSTKSIQLSINNISQQLKYINQLSNLQFQSAALTQQIQNILTIYNNFKQSLPNLPYNPEPYLQLLNNPSITKLTKLRQAQLQIQIITNLQDPIQQSTLLQTQQQNLEITLFPNNSFTQYISTALSTIQVSVSLQMVANFTKNIRLLNMRDIQINSSNSGGLAIDCLFVVGSGLGVYYSEGLFINETGLQVESGLSTYFKDFVPVQMYAPLYDIPEIAEHNIIKFNAQKVAEVSQYDIIAGKYSKLIDFQILHKLQQICINNRKQCIFVQLISGYEYFSPILNYQGNTYLVSKQIIDPVKQQATI